MEVLQPESEWIKEALKTIPLKTGKSGYSLSVKETLFAMQVIIKNNLPHKKKKKQPLVNLISYPSNNKQSFPLTTVDILKLRRKLLLKLNCSKSSKMLKLLNGVLLS